MDISDTYPKVKNNIPKCVGIIMDGNRRYARALGVSTLSGHREGLRTLKKVSGWAFDAGVRTLIVYAFSTENWQRPAKEISYLMRLFVCACTNELAELVRRGIRICFLGEKERMPKSLLQQAIRLEKETENALGQTLVIAFSYGSRAEIVSAVNVLMRSGKTSVTEEDIRMAMWSNSLPDPDLIIRTGGEQRLSNFLLFQVAYSELFFTKTMWPAFTKREFEEILSSYALRERRHGE